MSLLRVLLARVPARVRARARAHPATEFRMIYDKRVKSAAVTAR